MTTHNLTLRFFCIKSLYVPDSIVFLLKFYQLEMQENIFILNLSYEEQNLIQAVILYKIACFMKFILYDHDHMRYFTFLNTAR